MKKYLLIALVLVALLGSSIFWWMTHNTSQSEIDLPPTPVHLVSVQNHKVPVTIGALGTLLAPQNITLKALQAGQITGIYFKAGQLVKQGQILFTINDVAQKAAVAQAQAALIQAKANYQRYQLLFAQNAASQSDLDQYTATYMQDQAALAAAQQALSDTKITAPFDGVMGATQTVGGGLDSSGNTLSNITQITVGSYVMLGDALAQLVNLNHLQVQYNLPGEVISQAAVGQKVWLTTEAYAKPFTGVVSYVAPSVNQTTGTLTVYADVDSTAHLLEPGMLMQVTQILNSEHSVLAIPGLSIAADMAGAYVYQVEQGKLKKINIVTGNRTRNWVEVRKGLKLGDLVVAENLDSLQQGMAVKVVS